MIGNIPSTQYYQSFLQNRPVGFQGIKNKKVHSLQKDEILINGIVIHPKNYCLSGEKFLCNLENINFLEPTPLKEGLTKFSEIKCKFPYNIDRYTKKMFDLTAKFSKSVNKSPYLKDRKIHQIIANGTDSLIIDIGENPKTKNKEVLKISNEPNYPDSLRELPKYRNRFFERSFDMPIYDQNKIDGTYYYVQQKGDDSEVTEEHAWTVIKNIKDAGYEIDDLIADEDENEPDLYQIKLFNGRPFLIDPACAYKK